MNVVERLRRAGALSALDAELARGLGRLARETRDDVLLAVALASRANRDGHVCADLSRLAGSLLAGEDETPVATCPDFAEWRAQLSTSALVSDGSLATPMVLDDRGRLYLRRHFEHERRLASALRDRVGTFLTPGDPAALKALCTRLFGAKPEAALDRQRLAAQIAALSPLSIVSGGPGTGKTSTVVKIVALALADARARGIPHPRALLLAPTGKAAARLAEATVRAKALLDCPADLVAAIPDEARTLHRALEVDAEGHFRIDANRQLFADIVVVDEASMIDVSLMRHLVEAVPMEARLVLLGDRHQLSSVEAGAVLADICGSSPSQRYSRDLGSRIANVFGEPLPEEDLRDGPVAIDDAVVTLTKTYRFDSASSLGAVAAAVQAGDADGTLAILSRGSTDVVFCEATPDGRLSPELAARMKDGFRPLAGSRSPEEALERLGKFRVLCANRRGPLGVEQTNELLERLLFESRSRTRSGFLRPVMVGRNDPQIDLYNGDVGVLFRGEAGRVRAVFPGKERGTRALSPSRLPDHEAAFAMSIHKSQGSEFEDVVVVLPPAGSPLLSRELLYTALTRARRSVCVYATPAAVREAVNRPVKRDSGLAEALRRSW